MFTSMRFVAAGIVAAPVHPAFAAGFQAAIRRPTYVAAAVHALRQMADRARARQDYREVEAIETQIEKLLEGEEPING